MLTDKQLKAIESFAKSYVIAQACREVGISRPTFYNWRRDNKEFDERIKAIEETYVDMAEYVLNQTLRYGYKTTKEGEVVYVKNEEGKNVPLYSKEAIDAAKFILARKGKSRGYVESIDINADMKAMQTKIASREEVIDIEPEDIKRIALQELKDG